MAVGVGHELLGHDQDADAHTVEDLGLFEMRRLVVYPFDQILDLLHERVGGGHVWVAGVTRDTKMPVRLFLTHAHDYWHQLDHAAVPIPLHGR